MPSHSHKSPAHLSRASCYTAAVNLQPWRAVPCQPIPQKVVLRHDDGHTMKRAMIRAVLIAGVWVMTAPLTYSCLYQCGKRIPSSHAAFHRLRHISSYLSGERAHFLSLSCQHVALFAPIVRLQFHGLSQVLRTGETLREIEAGIDVALGDVDDLPVEGYRSLISRIEGSLPALHYVFQRILGALIGFSHLSDVPFGEIAHCLRYLSVSC